MWYNNNCKFIFVEAINPRHFLGGIIYEQMGRHIRKHEGKQSVS